MTPNVNEAAVAAKIHAVIWEDCFYNNVAPAASARQPRDNSYRFLKGHIV